jgi:hypothetical protein
VDIQVIDVPFFRAGHVCNSARACACYHRGVLQDPYGEFLVVEDRTQTKETLEEDFNARLALDDTFVP